jgi:hypothetical protein
MKKLSNAHVYSVTPIPTWVDVLSRFQESEVGKQLYEHVTATSKVFTEYSVLTFK